MEATDIMRAAPAPTLQQRAASELRALGGDLQLQPVRAGEASRAELEAYVQARFAMKHGAEVRTFMPTLISFRDRQGELRGVPAFAAPLKAALYLEQYLDQPIEARLQAGVQLPTPSTAAVPVRFVATRSSKSATSPRTGRALPAGSSWLAGRRLAGEGLRWVAFTGHPALINSFRRLGLGPQRVGPADPRAWARS